MFRWIKRKKKQPTLDSAGSASAEIADDKDQLLGAASALSSCRQQSLDEPDEPEVFDVIRSVNFDLPENQDLSQYNLDVKDEYGYTPFHIAIEYDNDSFFRAAVKAGINITQRDVSGDTWVHIAARRRSPKVISYLASQGANLDRTNNAGDTPLLEAIYKYCSLFNLSDRPNGCAVDALIASGANVNKPDRYFGITPLRVAVHEGDLELIIKLISAGANVKKISKHGTSVLDIVNANRMDIYEVLIEAGAKFHIRATRSFAINTYAYAQQNILRKKQEAYQKYLAVVSPLRRDNSSYFFQAPRDIVDTVVGQFVAGCSVESLRTPRHRR